MALFDERGPWMTPCELLDDRKLVPVHVPKYLPVNVLSFHCMQRPFIGKFFKGTWFLPSGWVWNSMKMTFKVSVGSNILRVVSMIHSWGARFDFSLCECPCIVTEL